MVEHIKGNNEKLEESVTCSKCNHEAHNSFEFCPECNEKLKEACHACQKEIHRNWRYCPYCGDVKGVEE